MALTFQSKYIIIVFLHLINDVRNVFTTNGNEGSNTHSQIVSNAQGHTALYWPKGIVTYYMNYFTYDYIIAQRVRLAMNVLESASCMRFKAALVKPAANVSWINITNPQKERNCIHEPIYKKDGEIVLALGFDCLKMHEILHTLLHAIGFHDEVTHPQRDQFIRVMWNNIKPEYRYLFRTQPSDETRQMVEYDPLSIMHFHDRAFSVNGHATVMPLVPGLLINPSLDLSQLDRMRLRLLFDRECNRRKIGDMIDTCKMIISNNERPNDSKNITDTKSEEKRSDPEDKDNEIHKADDNKEVDEEKEDHNVEEANKVNAFKIFKGKDAEEVKDDSETFEQGVKQSADLTVIENQYDLNEHHPDVTLNRLIPTNLLSQEQYKKVSTESVSRQESEDVQNSDD